MFQFPPPKQHEPSHTDYLHISDCTTGKPIEGLGAPSSPVIAPAIVVNDGSQPPPPPRPPKSEAVARAHTNSLHRSSDSRGSTRSAERSPSFAATTQNPLVTADDLYDFPRSTKPAASMQQPFGGSLRYNKPNRSPHAISSLNAVPNAPSSAPVERKHSYFNSATGFVPQGDEPYFINEDRAQLPTVNDLCSQVDPVPVRPPKRQQVQPPRPPKPANLQARRKVGSNTSLPNEPPEESEIQYLDLDLVGGDSDSSSPRTPSYTQPALGMTASLDAHHRHSMKKLNSSPKTPTLVYGHHYHQPSASMPVKLPSSGSTSPSSAYKTIDFIKTKALAQTNESNKASKTQLGI